MRKYFKTQCRNKISLLEEASGQVEKGIAKKNTDPVLSLLEDCQQTAIEIGTTIEKSEGEGTEAVRILEEYCEVVYQAHEELRMLGITKKVLFADSPDIVCREIKNEAI